MPSAPWMIAQSQAKLPCAGRRFGQAIVFGLLLLAIEAPAMAASPPAPAQPVQHTVGKVVFEALVTPDLTTEKQFYGKLFGWTFRDGTHDGVPYARAFLGEDAVADLFQARIPPNQRRQPAWLAFFSVADLDAARKIAVASGAKLLAEPGMLPHLGAEAILADPQGAVFAMLATTGGDQPDYLSDTGAWIWSSLMTRSPDRDAVFYKTVFADETYELPSATGSQHLLLASGGYARASVNSLPDSRPDAHPYWLSYVRVNDATATAAQAVALGGRVAVEPRVDRHGGKVAVLVDPLGAAFGLLEWSDQASGEPAR